MRGRAKDADRALEEVWLRRFGTLRLVGQTPVRRSDNGVIFQSRRLSTASREYGLSQEFITRYNPEQNGLLERFLKCLNEEQTWHHNFRFFEEARRTIARWFRFYNEQRPHQALRYQSLAHFRTQLQLQVA